MHLPRILITGFSGQALRRQIVDPRTWTALGRAPASRFVLPVDFRYADVALEDVVNTLILTSDAPEHTPEPGPVWNLVGEGRHRPARPRRWRRCPVRAAQHRGPLRLERRAPERGRGRHPLAASHRRPPALQRAAAASGRRGRLGA